MIRSCEARDSITTFTAAIGRRVRFRTSRQFPQEIVISRFSVFTFAPFVKDRRICVSRIAPLPGEGGHRQICNSYVAVNSFTLSPETPHPVAYPSGSSENLSPQGHRRFCVKRYRPLHRGSPPGFQAANQSFITVNRIKC